MDADDRRIRLLKDPTLSAVVEKTAPLAPRSVILFGSRASGSESDVPESRDYDIVVVLPTLRTPLVTRRLKRLEAAISGEFNANVSLNPAPLFRFRRPSGNFMAFKMAREGVVLGGADILGPARAMKPDEVTQFWHFFYLSSQAKRLLACAPSPEPRVLRDIDASHRAYSSAKTIAACAEIGALAVTGKYQTDTAWLTAWANESGNVATAGALDEAKHWRRAADDPAMSSELWWTAHRTVSDTHGQLAKRHFGLPPDSAEFNRVFLRSAGRARLARDAQFIALSLVSFRELKLRALLDKRGMAERVKLSTLALLRSLRRDMPPDDEQLKMAARLLSGVAGTKESPTPEAEWSRLWAAVDRYYPFACVALGV